MIFTALALTAAAAQPFRVELLPAPAYVVPGVINPLHFKLIYEGQQPVQVSCCGKQIQLQYEIYSSDGRSIPPAISVSDSRVLLYHDSRSGQSALVLRDVATIPPGWETGREPLDLLIPESVPGDAIRLHFFLFAAICLEGSKLSATCDAPSASEVNQFAGQQEIPGDLMLPIYQFTDEDRKAEAMVTADVSRSGNRSRTLMALHPTSIFAGEAVKYLGSELVVRGNSTAEEWLAKSALGEVSPDTLIGLPECPTAQAAKKTKCRQAIRAQACRRVGQTAAFILKHPESVWREAAELQRGRVSLLCGDDDSALSAYKWLAAHAEDDAPSRPFYEQIVKAIERKKAH